MVSSSASPAKGFDVFLDALAVTAGMRGVIVGPDPGAMITDRIARLGLRERVVLTGRIETVGAIYGAIDALVVPSTRYESTTLVALEAMAASRPVIASRLSGIPEVVADGRTGRLFAPGDVVGLAGLLADLATAPGAWRAMGEAGRRRWEAAFTLPRMAGALLTVYDELVGPK
jgi:glycosyltransferase involved in cell wall biosynthesis